MTDTNEPPIGGGFAERLKLAETRHLSEVIPPTLESINRSRLELWLVTFLLMLALAGAVSAFSFVDELPDWLRDFGGAMTAARASLVALAIGFAAYAFDKERRMRHLTAQLLNSRVLEAALLNRLNEVMSLGEASRSLGRAFDLDEALEAILRIGLELLEADEGSLMLSEEEGLVVAAAVGRARMFTGERVSLHEGLAGGVAATRQPVIVAGRVAGTYGHGIRWAMSVPLETEGDLVGVLNLSVTSGSREYNEYDLRALTLYAEQAALTIRVARARRHDRVRAEMAASMAEELREVLVKVQRKVTVLARHEEHSSPGRTESLRGLEHDLDRVLDLVRWLTGSRERE